MSRYNPAKRHFKIRILIIIFIFHYVFLFGQKDTSTIFNPNDYYYTVKECFNDSLRKANFTDPAIRYKNVLSGHRIWRTVSLENKSNRELFWSKRNCVQVGLFEVLKFGVFEKQLSVFDRDDFNDAPRHRISAGELKKGLVITDTLEERQYDANGEEKVSTRIVKRYAYEEDIIGYLLKEDWVINSSSGSLERRIVGMAPLMRNKQGKAAPLFWLYFQEWESLFGAFVVRSKVSGMLGDYRKILLQGQFISVVSKESNVFDRSIKSVKHAKDPALESELIKEKVINFESDLFQY